MSDSVFLIDDLRAHSREICACRICHEEDFERLEAPCACSGTVKFAHRDCIQRWCNEKGNTTCEICLQKFEPGYTSPPQKTQLIHHTTVTIRVSLEDSRMRAEQLETDSSAADKSVTYCRSVALVMLAGIGGVGIFENFEEGRSRVFLHKIINEEMKLSALLLIRHVCAVVLAGGVGGYPFSLLTASAYLLLLIDSYIVLVAKISGIIFPMYILLRIIAALHETVRHHYQNSETDM